MRKYQIGGVSWPLKEINCDVAWHCVKKVYCALFGNSEIWYEEKKLKLMDSTVKVNIPQKKPFQN